MKPARSSGRMSWPSSPRHKSRRLNPRCDGAILAQDRREVLWCSSSRERHDEACTQRGKVSQSQAALGQWSREPDIKPKTVATWRKGACRGQADRAEATALDGAARVQTAEGRFVWSSQATRQPSAFLPKTSTQLTENGLGGPVAYAKSHAPSGPDRLAEAGIQFAERPRNEKSERCRIKRRGKSPRIFKPR